MSNLIVSPVALEASVLLTVQQSVIDGYTETKSAFEGLQENAQKLIAHCVAVDALTAINDTASALFEAGHVGFAGNLRSWASRSMVGVVNDREANSIRVGAKRIESGLALAFTPEFTAEPKMLGITTPKARGEKNAPAKAVDPKSLLRLRKKIIENGLDGKYSDEQIAAVNAAMLQIVATLGLV